MRLRPIILAVAPYPDMAHAALRARGIDPLATPAIVRMATRPLQLRGWSRGTPVVAQHIDDWPFSSAAGADLAACLLALLSSGQLRLLQDAEIEALRADAA